MFSGVCAIIVEWSQCLCMACCQSTGRQVLLRCLTSLKVVHGCLRMSSEHFGSASIYLTNSR